MESIWGLFIWFALPNDLEVRAQTLEDTSQYSTQYRTKIKLQHVSQHGFCIQDEILFPFTSIRTSFMKYATLSVHNKGQNTNIRLEEREGKGDVAVD